MYRDISRVSSRRSSCFGLRRSRYTAKCRRSLNSGQRQHHLVPRRVRWPSMVALNICRKGTRKVRILPEPIHAVIGG